MTAPSQPTPASVVKVDPANPHQQPLFQISPTLDENRALDLRPVYISLGLDLSAFPKELGGIPTDQPSPFSLPKGVFDTALRAPVPFANLIWFFKGDSFFTYTERADGNDEVGDPTLIAANDGSSFAGDWPPRFATGIDAALLGTGSFEGKVWFFKGSENFRLRLSDGVVEFGLQPIGLNFQGVSGAFAEGIDAAIHGLGKFFGVCWFFKGNQYLRFNLEKRIVEGEPRPILGDWGGDTWPPSFADGIDFAFYGTGGDAEKIYFFRGDQYILYNLKTDRVEAGPKPIAENWRMLARFLPPPQLFIVEQYALHTFHGEMGRGPIVEGQQIQVAPRAKTEFFILTKKSETIIERSSSNILESQSEQSAKIFSEAVRNDESKSGSEDKFDYQVDTSFHGKADVTLLPIGGETSADLKVKGAAQDVRTAFARGVSDQTAHQATETHDLHKQQVTTAEATHVVNQEIETGFKQTIDNTDNPNPLNCLIFQLTQEYIVVLCLVDVKLAFHNSNPRHTQIVPIRDMPKLLDQCIVEPAARARIAATVLDVLKNVVDHAGQTRSLIVPNPNDPARFQVDRTLTTTAELKDSTGSPLRSIVVPGIILNIDRPVVLTPNTAMAPLEVV